jgi:hypothetical protein
LSEKACRLDPSRTGSQSGLVTTKESFAAKLLQSQKEKRLCAHRGDRPALRTARRRITASDGGYESNFEGVREKEIPIIKSELS